MSIMSGFKHFKATKLRDKLYGLLGIYEGATAVSVDYSKPMALVYAELVRFQAEQSGKLYLRQFPYSRAVLLAADLPSWTHDFDRGQIEDIRGHVGVHEGGGWQSRLLPTSSPYFLRTLGCTIDTVRTAIAFEDKATRPDRLINFIRNNITMSHPTGVTFLQALCCTCYKFRERSELRNPKNLFKIRSFLH